MRPNLARRIAPTPFTAAAPAGSGRPPRDRVPVRTILATIGLVVAAALALLLVYELARVLVWILIAAFFAVALAPLVGWVQRRVGGRRWLATLLVFLVALLLFIGLAALFIVPLAHEGGRLVDRAPDYYEQVKNGDGPLGHLAQRLHVQQYVADNTEKIKAAGGHLGSGALAAVRAAVETVVGLVTIFVLAYLMVLEGPELVRGTFNLFDEPRRSRIERVAADSARMVTGYLTGALLIAVICGLLTFTVLKVMGVPYAGLIALFVAFSDLIPLIGATIGAVVAVTAAFLESTTAGIVVVIFFVAYQQLENHVLQPVVQSRTVKLNPLAVIIAILVGVELAGVLGALLAIPVAGIIQVVIRDVWDNRRGAFKAEPTVGPHEEPVDEASADPAPA